MAEKLGYPILVSKLTRVFEETMLSMVPDRALDGSVRTVSIRVPPLCRRSLRTLLADISVRRFRC
jgi:hypothetical protein